jgi:hypothetical protein
MNFEVESYVVQWVVQIEEDMHGLRAVKDHMPFWGVDNKEMCYYQLVLRLQKGRNVN